MFASLPRTLQRQKKVFYTENKVEQLSQFHPEHVLNPSPLKEFTVE